MSALFAFSGNQVYLFNAHCSSKKGFSIFQWALEALKQRAMKMPKGEKLYAS